jgi:hypothetical protein
MRYGMLDCQPVHILVRCAACGKFEDRSINLPGCFLLLMFDGGKRTIPGTLFHEIRDVGRSLVTKRGDVLDEDRETLPLHPFETPPAAVIKPPY